MNVPTLTVEVMDLDHMHFFTPLPASRGISQVERKHDLAGEKHRRPMRKWSRISQSKVQREKKKDFSI